ncbi:hypothetical protein [Streptomyces scabiei]|uniref:hypothetical protein n=1 Tax=Streptomyces scabiei TaxID=1930 RepID=UPI0004E6234F|nr:hypothetical protein [Streptomyces scabiei]KFG05603.1 hypothetical protein IQ61_29410 [Streptomyces scabiei]MDX2829442.1 hypothetical protein [Streptomyces scabiei]MDX3675002.1 hypothetical protein [Streptomyces scabiei]
MSQPTGTPLDQTTPDDPLTAAYEKFLAAALVDVTGRNESLADQAHAELLAADRLTNDELTTLISRAGRCYAPEFVAVAYVSGKITAETLAALVGAAWSEAEYPDRELHHDTWRRLFDTAGFTVDGKRAERPTEPEMLFRGSVPERRTDWSWTRNRAVAERFAAGIRGRAPGHLWVCEVPPGHMLAVNTERDEDEVVVDTRGLQILEVVR